MSESLPKLESPFNRFVAAAIDDGLWFTLGWYILLFAPPSLWDDHPAVGVVLLFVLCSGWWNYFAFAESRWGRTFGKKVMGMRVLAAEGSKATFAACSIRNFFRPLDYLLIGPVMMLTTKRHQRLGDKFGRTIVVDEHKARPAGLTIPGGSGTTRGQAAPAEDTPLTERQHRPLPERRDGR